MDTQGGMQINEEGNVLTYVSNGSVDYRGRIADKRTTGGWKAGSFIIVNEVAERMAYFAIVVSMTGYLVGEMHQSVPDAATHVTDWIGASYMLTILGAFLADAYLGRFKTIVTFSGVYAAGMILLTVSGSFDSLRPPPCTAKPCIEANAGQNAFLYCALALIALGTGGIKPCVSTFGADQFDEADEKEALRQHSFFDWFFLAINIGAIFGITVLVYIQDLKGWSVGFGIPAAAIILSMIVALVGMPYYRYQKPMGSPFTRHVQVIVASLKNHFKGVELGHEDDLYEVTTKESDIIGARKLSHTSQYRFLDKAAVITDPEAINKSRWRLCTVTQVEELKSFVRILPIWAATLALPISFGQQSTFWLSQSAVMNRKLGSNFTIPNGCIPIFSGINAIFLIPLYEKVIIPLLRKRTGHSRGLTSLQRMGVGLFASIIALASAALVEKWRREKHPTQFSMSVFWLFPQFFLIGSAEVFTYVGQLEFFYNEASDGTRSISSAIFLSEVGLGSWLASAIVKIVQSATGGPEQGWLRDDPNESKLDYYYWVLAGINGFNFCVFLWVSWRYKGRVVTTD